MQFIEECSLKGLPQKLIVEVFKSTPPPGMTNVAFGNETVVRIPFEVTAKGMENTDKAGSKTLRFVGIMEHSKDNAADRREKAVKESPVSKEKGTQLLSDGKDAVSVWNVNEFERHGSSPFDCIFNAAGRAESAVAPKGYKFKCTTGRASVHGAAKGRVSTVNHFFNIVDNGLSRMKKINHFFIMVSKNVL